MAVLSDLVAGAQGSKSPEIGKLIFQMIVTRERSV